MEKYGYDQIPTISANVYPNHAKDIMQLAKDDIDPSRLLGYISTPWYMTTASDRYSLLNEAQRYGDAIRYHYPK